MRGIASARREEKIGVPRSIVERLASVRSLPYPLTALVLSLLITLPGRILACLLDSMSLRVAIQRVLPPPGTVPLWRVIAGNSVLPLVAFYVFLIVKYMRKSIESTGESLASIIPGGRRGYSRAFRLVGKSYGPIPIAAILVLLFSARFRSDLHSATGLFDVVFAVVSMSANMLLYATVIWAYFSSLYGMLRIGRMRLRTRPYFHDELLGLRPLGTLSLSLASSYFGALFLLIVFHLFNRSFAPELVMASLAALLAVGVLGFFLPLARIHRTMAEVKLREKAALRLRLERATSSPGTPTGRGKGRRGSPTGTESILADVRSILAYNALEHRVATLPTWPLDLAILERLLAILFAVIVGILVRVITATVLP
jgi:hypothetical protein